ncbi:tetratricopeptide repeat protein, partial [Thermodesulfobacteriota bacterium]
MMKPFISRHWVVIISAISVFACVPAVSNVPHGSLPIEVGSERMDNSYYYYTEAQLALKKDRVDHAIQLLLKASDIDSTSVFLDLELASLYLSQKKTAEALLALEKGLAMDPD